MKYAVILISAIIGLSMLRVNAQTANDPNEGLRLTQSSSGNFSVSWWGKSQRKYYLQTSENLIDWTYVPLTSWGNDSVVGWGLATEEPRMFVKLEYEDPPSFLPPGTTWGSGGAQFDQSATSTTGYQAASWPLSGINAGLNPLPNSVLNFETKSVSIVFEGGQVYNISPPYSSIYSGPYIGEKSTTRVAVEGLTKSPAEGGSATADYSQILTTAASIQTQAPWATNNNLTAVAELDHNTNGYTWHNAGPPATSGDDQRVSDFGTFSDNLIRYGADQPVPQEVRRSMYLFSRVYQSNTLYSNQIIGIVTFIIPQGEQASTAVEVSSGITSAIGIVNGGTFRLLAPSPDVSGRYYVNWLSDTYADFLPAALPVNTDFDEQKIGANGFALPDSADESLIAAQGADAGKITTNDLWTGYFGLSPALIPNNIRQASGTPTASITRVTSSGDEEEGAVRMHFISRDSSTTPYTTESVQFGGSGGQSTKDLSSWYAESMVGKWQSSFEGIQLGPLTLKFTYDKGDFHFEQQQTFEICTYKTTAQWLAEIHDQILLQTGGRADLDNYLPYNGQGWQPQSNFVYNTREVAIIYEWYGQLFRQNPDKMDWMGIARMVGAAVYGGLSDSQALGASSATKPLMGGQVLIYKDMAWPHRAYLASGIKALEWIKENDDSNANGVSGVGALVIENWRQFDAAFTSGNYAAMQTVTKELTNREQRQIIKPMWDYLDLNSSGVVSAITNAARNVVDPDSPTFLNVISELNPTKKAEDIRASVADQRMQYSFDSTNHSVFPIWWGFANTHAGPPLDSAGRLALVQIPFAQRATVFSSLGYIYPP